jgi:hypothetical protein
LKSSGLTSTMTTCMSPEHAASCTTLNISICGQQRSRMSLIRLEHIYNFYCSMLLYYQSWMFYIHFIATLYHFSGLTIDIVPSASCCFLLVFYFAEYQYQTKSNCHETFWSFFDVDQIMNKASKSEVHASTNVKSLEQPKEDMGETIILVGKLPVPILGEMTHQISSCNFPPKPN